MISVSDAHCSREGDNIYDIAHEFALKHGLPRDITYKLAGHLQENLEVQLKQQVVNLGQLTS